MRHHSRNTRHGSGPSRSRAGRLITTSTSQSAIESILYLEQNHVRFNAPSKSESVFFDECNREIISLTSKVEPNKTRVLFQSTENSDRVEFFLPIEKRILSIKLNPSRNILAYHVERNILEFINVKEVLDPTGQKSYALDDKRYVQTSRAKNSKLIGFLWTGASGLVIITDLSVEFYHVEAHRRRVKFVKLFQSITNWFVYQPPADYPSQSVHIPPSDDTTGTEPEPYSILMVSTGSLGNSMQPYLFIRDQMIRLQRFEVEGSWNDSEKLELFERSITIADIYGYIRLLVLQHESLNVKSKGAQIVIYTVDLESGQTSRTHTLDLDVSGRFAINILDNLVIAHDQPSKSSFIFDIMVEQTEKSDCPNHFVALLNSRPIRPLQLQDDPRRVDMYSLNWVFFQPNYIVDAKLGLLSALQLDLSAIEGAIHDNLLLLSFLANRRNSEKIIIRKCKQIVAESYAMVTKTEQLHTNNPLADVSAAFDIIGRLVVSAPELGSAKELDDIRVKTSNQQVVTADVGRSRRYGASILQEDIQREIFKDLFDGSDFEKNPATFHFVTSSLSEIIFSMQRHERAVEFCIYEYLSRCLISDKRYYQVVQLVRSDIFKDSKQLACMLLSIRNEYRPAAQLGLNMLNRLNCLKDLDKSIDLNTPLLTAGASQRLSSSARSSVQLDHHSIGVESI